MGSLGDRGYVTVQRGSQVVLERPPPSALAALPTAAEEDAWSSDLGRLFHGDRLTLRWEMPVPGKLAVVHVAGDSPEAELSLLLPGDQPI